MSQPTPQRRPARERDLTTGSPGRHALTLSLPTSLENAISGSTGLIHAFWMGRVGGTALAAVAVANTLRIVIISPMMGLSAGGMAVVARHIGAREQRHADKAVMQTILLAILFIVPLITLGLIGGRTFLGWMGAEGELLDEAMAYLRIILWGLLFGEMLPSINAVIRAAGHPEYTFRTQVVSIIVMLSIEPLLVLGVGPFPALGVRAAAWASVLSSVAGVAAQMLVLIKGWAGLQLHLADAIPDLGVMWRILRVAMPSSLQRFSPNLGNALMMRLAAALGEHVLTAYSVALQVYTFLQCTTFGFSGAAGTLMGQNLGAKRPDRAERATVLSSLFGAIAAFALMGAASVAPFPVLRLFNCEVAVMAAAATALRYMTLTSSFQGWSVTMGTALTGAGDMISVMAINIASLWLAQLPLCYLFSQPLGWGPTGLWVGLALANLASALAMTWRFKQGRWKTLQV